MRERERYLADEHLNTSLKKQRPPPKLINTKDRNKSTQTVHSPQDNRRQQRRVALEPTCLEQDRPVEHDRVDPRELLEDLEHHPDHERRPALSPQQLLERLVYQLRLLARSFDLLVLRVDVRHASDTFQGFLAGGEVAALDEGGRGFRDEEGTDEEDQGGGPGEAEGSAPPVGVEVGDAVVNEVGDEDADGDEELEEDVYGSSVLDGCHL